MHLHRTQVTSALRGRKKTGSAKEAQPGFLEDSVCVNGASGRNQKTFKINVLHI